MKGILITDGNDNYSVLDYNNELLGTTIESMVTNQKLSLKNCEEIKNGYDLDELFESVPRNLTDEDDKWKLRAGFITGFQKALEIIGDKKFSENDIDKAFDAGHEMLDSSKSYNDSLKELKESLQQTEWDVVIITEPMNLDEIIEQGNGFLSGKTNKPKLDENGCLILKRI